MNSSVNVKWENAAANVICKKVSYSRLNVIFFGYCISNVKTRCNGNEFFFYTAMKKFFLLNVKWECKRIYCSKCNFIFTHSSVKINFGAETE